MEKEDFYERTDCEKVDYAAELDLDEEDDSPIQEVRVTISNKDDPKIPCNTFRMWFLGLLFTSIISFINQFFYLRQTTISIGYSVVALLSLPLGHLMARFLPTTTFTLFGKSFTLNPGPFSLKEHVLIGTMTACNTNTAYAVDIVMLQKLFYHNEKPFIAGLLLVWTTQVTGFALAGVLRKFLVKPAHMIWPSTLVTAALFRSLHTSDEAAESEAERGRMSRIHYFAMVGTASFIWYWFPDLFFPTVGVISWICWIKPDNIVLAQLTGSNGLGIGTISLDWAAINSYVQPMVVPWFAQVNILVGFILVVYVMVPWAYYTDLWNSKRYPILSPALFREDGQSYNISEVSANGVLQQQRYTAYGPLRMDSFFALTYGVGFAGLTATVVHVLLFNGREMLQRWRSSRTEHEDIHSRLMRVYPEVPNFWYSSLFVITFGLSFFTCVIYGLMPWWAVILALALSVFFVLPVGIVQAVTNQQPGLNIVTEYVIGYLLPGRAIDNVTFKTYGYIVNVQALTFTSDLKLGHYMKIPPRVMFMAQVVSTLLSGLINLVTANWLVETHPQICTKQGYPFTCRNTHTFYSASIIWGAIGPARVFGHTDGALYSPVQWGFLVGMLLPLLSFAAIKLFPRITWLQYVHWPVLLAATSNMPPALPYFYTNGLFWGFIFMFVLRRYRYDWWARYNYLTSAALDTGLAIAGLVIFCAVTMRDVQVPNWWGNPNTNIDFETASLAEMNAASIDHCYHGYSNYYGEQL
ncbi:hypothetical protein BGZ73_000757 [Actinomortierella ambigua]|nr:hypothetical protein BGZ73_000757 [Actinomortierella ambigua]